MALTNKQGQTPAEAQEHDELLAYLAQHTKDQNVLLNRLETIEKQLTTQQQFLLELSRQYTLTNPSGDLRNITREVKSIVSYVQYVLVSILVLGTLLLLSHHIISKKIATTQGIVYSIESILQKESTFWYDAENRQLYLKDTSSNT